MPFSSISRANNGLPKMTRSKVKPHQLFQLVKNGKASGTVFANLGHSRSLGRDFSIAVKSAKANKAGLLYGSNTRNKGTSEVAVVGSFQFEATFFKPNQVRTVRRGTLEAGDIFQVPTSRKAKNDRYHKPPMYVALGKVDDNHRVLSYNLNTKDLAVGRKLNGSVAKVGTADIIRNEAA